MHSSCHSRMGGPSSSLRPRHYKTGQSFPLWDRLENRNCGSSGRLIRCSEGSGRSRWMLHGTTKRELGMYGVCLHINSRCRHAAVLISHARAKSKPCVVYNSTVSLVEGRTHVPLWLWLWLRLWLWLLPFLTERICSLIVMRFYPHYRTPPAAAVNFQSEPGSLHAHKIKRHKANNQGRASARKRKGRLSTTMHMCHCQH